MEATLFKILFDRLAVNRAKKQLISALDIARRRGADGISIPSPDDPNTPREMIRAAEELVGDPNGRVTVARFRDRPMLCFRADILPTLSAEMEAKLVRERFFGSPGDSLTSDPQNVGKRESK